MKIMSYACMNTRIFTHVYSHLEDWFSSFTAHTKPKPSACCVILPRTRGLCGDGFSKENILKHAQHTLVTHVMWITCWILEKTIYVYHVILFYLQYQYHLYNIYVTKTTTRQLVIISHNLYVSQLKLKMPKLEGVKTTFSGENSNQFYNLPLYSSMLLIRLIQSH